MTSFPLMVSAGKYVGLPLWHPANTVADENDLKLLTCTLASAVMARSTGVWAQDTLGTLNCAAEEVADPRATVAAYTAKTELLTTDGAPERALAIQRPPPLTGAAAWAGAARLSSGAATAAAPIVTASAGMRSRASVIVFP